MLIFKNCSANKKFKLWRKKKYKENKLNLKKPTNFLISFNQTELCNRQNI